MRLQSILTNDLVSLTVIEEAVGKVSNHSLSAASHIIQIS